jgi:cbb3-type cytochrome oxidase maturation protein
MPDFFYLIPLALALGAVGLAAFMWSLTAGQYDDLAGAAERIFLDEHDSPITDEDGPIANSIRRDHDSDAPTRQGR